MARPTTWRRTVSSATTAQSAWRLPLVDVAPGETVTRVLCEFYLINQGIPTVSASVGWTAGIYAVNPGDTAPLPDPREPGSYPWLWHGLTRPRSLYDDPTAQPADATVTELSEPYEGHLDLHGQRLAATNDGLSVQFAAAPFNIFTGSEAYLIISMGVLVLQPA